MMIALLIGSALLSLALFYNPKWLILGLSLISFGIYFEMPNGDILTFIIFLLGILLIIIEFYVPDFGVIGIAGLLAVIISLFMHIGNISTLILTILAVLLVASVAIIIPLRMGRSLTIGPNFVLETSSNKEAGYSSQKDYSFLTQANGVSITTLRPVGRAEFDGSYYEVISLEDMIKEGESIYVARVEGAKIYVRKGVYNG